MADKKVLAFDLGASSGRGMLARFDGTKIVLEEIHRFPHNFSMLSGHAYWNLLHLMDEMKEGLKKCTKDLEGVGFDTWGVDCGCLSAEGDLLSMPGSYRDPALNEENRREALLALNSYQQPMGSTAQTVEEAVQQGEKFVFSQTGIASLEYNTLYKLYYMQKYMPSILEQTKTILMMPNLIEYLFSGVKHSEYSIMSTSQLYDMQNKCYAKSVFEGLQLNASWFTEVELSGRNLGKLRRDLVQETGQKNLHIISAPGHDTACAVAAVPAKEEQYTFLSSGTWSLMGISSKTMLTDDDSIANKISNEGTWDGGYRPTVNIIGLWLQQEIRRNFASEGREYSFGELVQLAMQEKPLQSFIRPDDFMQPGEYPEKIREYCRKTGQPVPQTDGALVRCILESLALKYKQTYLSFKPYITWEEKLYIVGGGVQNQLLNQFTANALGIPVITGASEATAAGNVMAQLKALGCFHTNQEKSEILAASFDTHTYMPQEEEMWQEAYAVFEKLYEPS